jgi:hypothetical protein
MAERRGSALLPRLGCLALALLALILSYLWANVWRGDPRAPADALRMDLTEYVMLESHIPIPPGFRILPQPNVRRVSEAVEWIDGRLIFAVGNGLLWIGESGSMETLFLCEGSIEILTVDAE